MAQTRATSKAPCVAAHDVEGAVILDCEDLSYISSAGLCAMRLIAKALATRDMPFALCSLTDSVAEVLHTADSAGSFPPIGPGTRR